MWKQGPLSLGGLQGRLVCARTIIIKFTCQAIYQESLGRSSDCECWYPSWLLREPPFSGPQKPRPPRINRDFSADHRFPLCSGRTLTNRTGVKDLATVFPGFDDSAHPFPGLIKKTNEVRIAKLSSRAKKKRRVPHPQFFGGWGL